MVPIQVIQRSMFHMWKGNGLCYAHMTHFHVNASITVAELSSPNDVYGSQNFHYNQPQIYQELLKLLVVLVTLLQIHVSTFFAQCMSTPLQYHI